MESSSSSFPQSGQVSTPGSSRIAPQAGQSVQSSFPMYSQHSGQSPSSFMRLVIGEFCCGGVVPISVPHPRRKTSGTSTQISMETEAIARPPTMTMAMTVHKQQFCNGNPLVVSIISVNGRLRAEHCEVGPEVRQGCARSKKTVNTENGERR